MKQGVTDARESLRRLTADNRQVPCVSREREMLELRAQLGERLRQEAHDTIGYEAAQEVFGSIGENAIPEIHGQVLSPEALAAGLQLHGALLVRGLYDEGQLGRLHALALAESEDPGARDERIGCSVHVLAELLELYADSGLLDSVQRYQGGSSLLFGERTKLRRQLRERDRQAAIPWHQDAAFFGRECRAVNCWAAVTPCGESNPCLSIVPRRFSSLVGWRSDQGHAPLNYGQAVSSEAFDELIAAVAPVNCVLQPGDALLFDEMTVHRTWPRPWRREDQVVTISWFFPASSFPDWGTPLAV